MKDIAKILLDGSDAIDDMRSEITRLVTMIAGHLKKIKVNPNVTEIKTKKGEKNIYVIWTAWISHSSGVLSITCHVYVDDKKRELAYYDCRNEEMSLSEKRYTRLARSALPDFIDELFQRLPELKESCDYLIQVGSN